MIIRGVWARNSNFLGLYCRVSEIKIGEINLFHLENIYLCKDLKFFGLDWVPGQPSLFTVKQGELFL